MSIKKRKYLVAVVACLLLLNVAGCYSYKKVPAKDLEIVKQVKPLDVIIVPGVPFKNNSWDSVMKSRVLWSVILYKNGYTKNIIYSGGAVYSPWFEAKIMGLYAMQMGVPADHIYYDTLARHSSENVYYSYLLAQKSGFKSIGLATDPFQAGLLRSLCRKRFETHIYQLPYVHDSVVKYNYLNPVIDPASAVAGKDFISITDKEGFWQRFRGTLGKNIKWNQYEHGRVGPL